MNAEIDLRTLPLSKRQAVIFEIFDGLAAGEALDLLDDRDPMPIYFRLDRLRAGEFSWRYLLTGPEGWQVRIVRLNAVRI